MILVTVSETGSSNGFKCSLSRASGNLNCMSSGGSLQTSALALRANNWYIMLVRVNGGSALELRQSNFDTLVGRQTSASFFPGGSSVQGLTIN